MKKLLLIFFMLFLASMVHAQPAKDHPEKGILPFNAPCQACIEEIEKRTANTREFFKVNADGSKSIYMQKSYGNMNFKDKDGFWRSKDPRVIKENEKLYAARMQPSPVVIDFENKFTSIINGGKELRFNKNISLVHITNNGTTTSLGLGNWNNVTRTENYTETIFLIADFYPGIDLQMITNFGRIETSFILKNRLPFTDGWLVMEQQVEIPAGLQIDLSQTSESGDNKRTGIFTIVNESNRPYFNFKKSYAFDAKERMENNLEMPFTWNGSQLDYFVPVNWLQNPSTIYPVTVDPFVNSSDTVYQPTIQGSGFTTAILCDTGGCSYFMDSLMTPPNCEITDIQCYFSYLTSLPCIRDDGGFTVTMTNPLGSSCTTRHFTCLGGVQGDCFFWPAMLLNAVPPLAPCVLPPQCASYPLNFELKFSRCNWVPIVACDMTCIGPNSDWIINVIGRTAGISAVHCSAPSAQICEGSSALLSVDTIGGVGPFSYLWQPGNLSGAIVSVSPDTTTQYTLIATDACGGTDTASITVFVVQKENPGFTISPPDTVCAGFPMVFSGNGNAAAASYDWAIDCPLIANFSDQQTLNYVAPLDSASCTATLNFQVVSGALVCNFDSTQNFVVQICSGINEQNDPVSSLFPNPTNKELTIVFASANVSRNIELFNVLGECRQNEIDFKGRELTLDLSALSKGIYFVKVSAGNQMSVHKIIVY